jgi:hypothetical protein
MSNRQQLSKLLYMPLTTLNYQCPHLYFLHPKINTILGLSTEINTMCKMTKIPLVLYEKDCLLCEKLLDSHVFCGWLVKVAFFVGQILNPRIAFILERREF